ncbi:DNA polymerase [Pseudomonas phage vB_PaeP_PAO1_Ab05]|uniref:Putative DNA polymerase n=1 Tax=Pseudomonas phage vB_PaeP_PAO1_Ab05 TaxID=1548902 RepID=A0A0A1IVI9_9CAUD|nr:DNA polymerase [Pseudomonas phage vB_PaeP_PAO1_Ab05]CEF89285.1 putative DNA polymerase [Pseudomonas phage vB_PaeP_PAO1_Ab05]
MTTIRILDLETESYEHKGRKASPFDPRNYIVMAGWRDDVDGKVGQKVEHRFRSRAEAEDPNNRWFNLDGVDVIVAHNAMFESNWFFTRYRDEYLAFLRRGGRVWCTQQAEYLLSHQTWLYPALDELAPKYGGTHKVDGIKMLWDQGVLTSEMDQDLLSEYLSGPCGDIENTALVFYGQLMKLQARGMWAGYLERCEALIGFSAMECAGLKVDLEVAKVNHAKQLEEVAGIEAELKKLMPDFPEYFEFKYTSLYHMSAWLYGGEVRYKGRVPYEDGRMEKADFVRFGTAKRGTPIESTSVRVPIHEVTDQGEWHWPTITELATKHGPVITFSAGKNKGSVKVFREDTDIPATKWDDDQRFRFPGLINLTNLPEVVREKFLGKRPEFQCALTLADGSPVFSTSGDALKALEKQGFEAAKLLMRLAELHKDNSSFYITHTYNKDGTIKDTKGMLQYVDDDGIIHHSLNTTATATTRLSSSRPNLQQLPSKDEDDPEAGSRVKEMFVSRFGADGMIGETDYTALEVVMLAALSKDRNLLAKLMAGTDMHLYRLAGKHNNWNGFDYDQLVAIKKDPNHPWHGRMMQARKNIKPKAFSAQYGASAAGIAFNTGCTVEEAQEFLDNEAALFPESIAFRQIVRDSAEATSLVMYKAEDQMPAGAFSEMGPDGNWRQYRRGFWQAPGGTCYSFRQQERWDKEQRKTVMDFKDTQIANYWNQGEAGFMMTVSVGRIFRWMLHRPGFMVTEFLINNVHDAVYTDCHKDTAAEVNRGVRDIMSDAPRYMSERLGYDMADVPFPAVAEMGPNMFNMDVIRD